MGLIITHPKTVYQLTKYLTSKKQEHLIGLYIDTRHHLIFKKTLTIGTLNKNLIHAREVFSPAIHKRAAGVIIVHNHPSGDPQPSKDDLTATEAIFEAGKILDIPLIDHVIIGKKCWFSLKEHQLFG